MIVDSLFCKRLGMTFLIFTYSFSFIFYSKHIGMQQIIVMVGDGKVLQSSTTLTLHLPSPYQNRSSGSIPLRSLYIYVGT